MEDKDENIEHAPVLTQETTISNAMQTIIKLTQHYQDSTLKYSQAIQNYNHEIEKIKAYITKAIESKSEEENIFLKCDNEVKYLSRVLEDTNAEFHKEIHALEELENEYRHSIDNSVYMRITLKKKQTLKKSLDKIEVQEEELLSQELERLNILDKLSPKRKEVEALQKELEHLELEKKHYESSKLQQVIQLPTLSTPIEDVIDIGTEEE